ncbi:MAG: class I SAM-dependent methyltransferase [Bacteroidota bacterium]
MQLLKNKIDGEKWFASDDLFNQLYPAHIQSLSRKHWTPLNVARKAAGFLSLQHGQKILDIGSGVGKFCLGAAYYYPCSFYYGIEQRRDLVRYAEAAKELLQSENISFIHGNFTQLDFRDFDHFYFYNSFYENLAGTGKIDENIEHSAQLYHYYTHYLFKQLETMPAGTKLATFHSLEEEVPADFHMVHSEFDGLLKCWIKA